MVKDPTIPKEIGGFKILEILGEGGMSIVYTAVQEHPRRKVAIKVLRGGMFSPTAVKRFHQEVEILGQLDHPWIAKIYDAGTHDDGNGAMPYYVMEHVGDARELTKYLEDVELRRRDVLKLFIKISSAVEHGHHRGIVHRDLKPGNILIDKKGEPKIIDFGVARSLDRTLVSQEAMTEAGRLVGTVQFMAPEQVDVKITDIDARCDVYALGAVLYQMLTKRLPRTLEGLPIYEAVRQICQEAPIRPTMYDGTIDQNLEAIILMALETNREKRYQTAGAFGRDMLRYLGNRTIKARRASTVDYIKLFYRRHKIQLLVCGIILGVVAIAISGLLYQRVESDMQVGELQAQVDELHRENEELEHATTTTMIQETKEDVEITPALILSSSPSDVVVSGDGTTLVAIVDDDYFAASIDGHAIRLPPINIEPSEATISISSHGKRLAVVSNRSCRLISLGQRTPPRQISGDFGGVEVVAVGENVFAVASTDMALHVITDGNRRRRATSSSGVYKAIAIGLPEENVIAATDYWVFVWRLLEFPKGVRKFEGVNDPCLVGEYQQRIVVIGRNGQIVVHESHQLTDETEPLQLDAEITHCAMNIETTLLGYISNEKAYLHDIERGETVEISWMQETPIGVALSEDGQIILWTSDGKVFRE